MIRQIATVVGVISLLAGGGVSGASSSISGGVATEINAENSAVTTENFEPLTAELVEIAQDDSYALVGGTADRRATVQTWGQVVTQEVDVSEDGIWIMQIPLPKRSRHLITIRQVINKQGIGYQGLEFFTRPAPPINITIAGDTIHGLGEGNTIVDALGPDGQLLDSSTVSPDGPWKITIQGLGQTHHSIYLVQRYGDLVSKAVNVRFDESFPRG